MPHHKNVRHDDIVIVLGSPNSPTGELSVIARDRQDAALRLAGTRPTARFLLTGGFGSHFNQSDQPHFRYARAYLLERGLDPDRLLEDGVPSRNTVEDAELSFERLRDVDFERITVVTSDFHEPRARKHFVSVFTDRELEFVCAKSSLPREELDRLIAAEKRGTD